MEDTSSSKALPKKDDVEEEEEEEEVNVDDLDLLHEILDYKNVKGVTPCDNPDHMREFCTPFIGLNIGNAKGWIRKMRELKTKFNNQSHPADDVEKQEFEVWKKIWGNEQPKRLLNDNEDADDRPNKRKKITDETEDTTSSKPPKKEEIVEVNYDTIEILQKILSYKNRNGVCPCESESPDDFRKFCFPYIQMGIGNAGGWVKKMEEMKNKFNNQSAPVEDVEKQEFEFWKMIWGTK